MTARIATLAALALAAAPLALGAEASAAQHVAAAANRSPVVSAQRPALVPGWPITGLARPVQVRHDGAPYVSLGNRRAALLNTDGTRRRIVPGPAGADGRFYAWQAFPGMNVSAYDAAGRLLWRSEPLRVGPEASNVQVRADPAANVYVLGEWGLVALDPTGRSRWQVRWGLETRGALAIGPDGTAYLGYVPSGDGVLVARRPDGQALWERPLGGTPVRVEVADDGTVIVAQTYAGGAALRAFAPDGTERWLLPTEHLARSMAIGADGTIYVTTPAQAAGGGVVDPGLVWAVGPDGRLRWTHRGPRIAVADPIVGGDGTIYVGAAPLVALRPDGSRAWAFPPTAWPLVPRAIGGDGTLYAEGGRAWFAIPGPSARRRVAPPTPAGQRALIAGLRISPTRLRMRGPAQLCPSAGRGCRPATPLGATVRFTLRRDAAVLVSIRRLGRRAVVARRGWRARRGTTWTGLLDAAAYRPLAPGRYALTVRAARGPARVVAGPVRFTVVR